MTLAPRHVPAMFAITFWCPGRATERGILAATERLLDQEARHGSRSTPPTRDGLRWIGHITRGGELVSGGLAYWPLGVHPSPSS